MRLGFRFRPAASKEPASPTSQADLDVPGHRPVSPHQGLDHIGEGPAFLAFEAQIVDHLAQALGAASDRVDSPL